MRNILVSSTPQVHCVLDIEPIIALRLPVGGDMYISSLADVHVVNENSGFSLVSALMRMRPLDQYRIHYITDPHCSSQHVVSLDAFANTWSGL